MRRRTLDWGCANARDLGGLGAALGARVRDRALVRAGAPDTLDAAGWAAVRDYGVRTVVDFRNDHELPAGSGAGVPGIARVHVPLGHVENNEFWAGWNDGARDAQQLHLIRHPELNARAIEAIARAEPGGVLLHCVAGTDRTGHIVAIVLLLLGVERDAIVADYALSLGPPPAGTEAAEAIVGTLERLDVEVRLRAGGLTEAALVALRARLLAS